MTLCCAVIILLLKAPFFCVFWPWVEGLQYSSHLAYDEVCSCILHAQPQPQPQPSSCLACKPFKASCMYAHILHAGPLATVLAGFCGRLHISCCTQVERAQLSKP